MAREKMLRFSCDIKGCLSSHTINDSYHLYLPCPEGWAEIGTESPRRNIVLCPMHTDVRISELNPANLKPGVDNQ